MKIRIIAKDTQMVDTIEDAAREHNIDFKELYSKLEKWILYGEIVEIELDTETGNAILVRQDRT